MRLWQWLVLIYLVATAMGLAREPVGRVAMVVFLTGLGEVVLGASALMLLFRTVGAFGRAEGPAEHALAVASTAAVLVVASLSMAGLLWGGVVLVMAVAT